MNPLTIDRSNFDALIDDAAGHLNAQHGRLIDLAIWLVANTSEWQGDGLWTPAQYLAWRAGISPAMASNLVAVAERADEVPIAIDKVRSGEMSFDQLLPIVRHTPAWADAQITSLAHRLTVSQVRRLVRETDWAWTPDPARDSESQAASVHSDDPSCNQATPDSEPPAGSTSSESAGDSTDDDPEANRVNYGFDDNGRWYLHADLDADLGAQIHQSLDEARDALFREQNHRDRSDDRPTHGADDQQGDDNDSAVSTESEVLQSASSPGARRRIVPASDADALAAVARRSLDGVGSAERRDRFRVNLFLDMRGNCATTERVPLPDSLRDLLTCDGRIDPVFVDGATPVSIGRSSRVIPDRLRRVVLHRDHGSCQVPGCTATHGLDLHHIVHWSRGGPTDSANLITVCSRHHRMHHKKRLGIAGNADDPVSLEFTDHRGQSIRLSGAQPTAPPEPPPPIQGDYEHPIGARLDRRWVTFVDPSVPRHLRHHHPGIAG